MEIDAPALVPWIAGRMIFFRVPKPEIAFSGEIPDTVVKFMMEDIPHHKLLCVHVKNVARNVQRDARGYAEGDIRICVPVFFWADCDP